MKFHNCHHASKRFPSFATLTSAICQALLIVAKYDSANFFRRFPVIILALILSINVTKVRIGNFNSVNQNS